MAKLLVGKPTKRKSNTFDAYGIGYPRYGVPTPRGESGN